MRWSTAAIATLLSSVHALPTENKVVKRQGGPDVDKANAVKEAFEFAWKGYSEHAFPNDELKPVTNGFANSRNGWGASAVDALSTALLMKEKDIVNQILDHISTLDYSKTKTPEPSEVSLFETTIRYLGGMLAGYDLLKGPRSDLGADAEKVDALLAQSKSLADAMKFGFDTESGIPHNDLWIEEQRTGGSTTNGLATTGTLVMEWVRLGDLSGDAKYAELAEKAESYLLSPKPAESEPFPGLVGSDINIASGEFENSRGGWSGGTDSFYEYLIKMWVYDQGRYSQYKDRWIAAADSTIEFLTSHPESKPEITYAAEYDGTDLVLRAGHLTCFHGGNFLLGGSVLGEQKYIDYGLKLAEGCRNTYVSTVTQIGPEGFGWAADSIPAGQEDFFDEHGFYILSSDYILRPEVLETFYYAYRITGDAKYQDWVWEGFQAINATTRVGSGFSAISDVNAEGGGNKQDNQESFWFAEVLKYCFLTFADDEEFQIQANGGNKWVFNTEAHPFQVKGEPAVPPY